MTNLYLDDERETPDGFERVYTAPECIKRLEKGDITLLSLDHDLGNFSGVGCGADVTKWLKEKVYNDPTFKMPAVFLHTQNPVGKENMKADLRWIWNLQQERKKQAE